MSIAENLPVGLIFFGVANIILPVKMINLYDEFIKHRLQKNIALPLTGRVAQLNGLAPMIYLVLRKGFSRCQLWESLGGCFCEHQEYYYSQDDHFYYDFNHNLPPLFPGALD